MNFHTLFNFRPGKEISIMNGCPQRCEGIWDTLGYYDSKSCLVTLCELEITNFTKKLRPMNNEQYKQIRDTLKELVRLHEHVHSLIHNCNFDNLKNEIKFNLPAANDSIYSKIPKEIKEPLCEFISFSAIKRLNWISYERLFLKVDEDSPTLYQRWREIKDVIDTTVKIKRKRDYILFTPSLVKISRNKIYPSFMDFIEEIKLKQNELHDEFKLLDAKIKLV